MMYVGVLFLAGGTSCFGFSKGTPHPRQIGFENGGLVLATQASSSKGLLFAW
jgi:hypothetical protein